MSEGTIFITMDRDKKIFSAVQDIVDYNLCENKLILDLTMTFDVKDEMSKCDFIRSQVSGDRKDDEKDAQKDDQKDARKEDRKDDQKDDLKGDQKEDRKDAQKDDFKKKLILQSSHNLCFVFKAKLNKNSILYPASMNCFEEYVDLKKNPLDSDSIRSVEIKLSKRSSKFMSKKKFHEIKTLKWWSQR